MMLSTHIRHCRLGCRRPCRTCCCCCRRPQQGACRCHHTPLTSSHGRAAYPIPPPSRLRVFGWLLRDKISNGGHLRPSLYFYFCNFFRRSIRRPKIRKTPPPYSPPRMRILSIISPIAAANYRLIVASQESSPMAYSLS
jgi:hypothetical protein